MSIPYKTNKRSLKFFKTNLYKLNYFTIFTSNLKVLKNSCVLEVYRKEFIYQVQQANFIAVIADEITDVSVQNQLSIVIKYINNGIVVERFWFFSNN